MRKALVFSFLMHVFMLAFIAFNIPMKLLPEPEAKAISIKLVAAKEVKKTVKKEAPKVVKTQQSKAPKNPPKKKKTQPKPKKVVTRKAPEVVKKEAPKVKEIVKKKEVKKSEIVKQEVVPKPEPVKPKPEEKPKPEPQEQAPKPEPVKKEPEVKPEPPKEEPEVVQEETPVSRPPKLDKTPDKKNVIKDKEPPEEPAKQTPDDFLKALSFVQDLKAKQSAMFEGEDTPKTTIDLAEQGEIAVIKKHIEKNWYKTPGTKGEQTAHIQVHIDREGMVTSLKVIGYEGSISFINSLKRAIRRASPLPYPIDKYDTYKVMDIHWSG